VLELIVAKLVVDALFEMVVEPLEYFILLVDFGSIFANVINVLN
jgi:hypothetical protein